MMKAKSIIFTQIQAPITLYGVRQELFILSCLLTVVISVLTGKVVSVALLFPSVLISLATLLGLSFYLTKKDIFCLEKFKARVLFFGSKEQKILMAGNCEESEVEDE